MIEFRYSAITPQQSQGFEDATPNLLLWGPGGSGKTHLGASKGIVMGLVHPHNRIFYIRRKKTDLRATLWKKFTELVPEDYILKKDEQRMVYILKNGTEFWGLGLDTVGDVNKLASTECSMAIIEEATEIPEEYFDEKIRRAVRMPGMDFYQTLLMCNPTAPSHWLYRKFITTKNKNYKAILFPTIPRSANVLPPSWYDWFEELTGVFAERYREGRWVGAEGLVYPFNPSKHIIEPFDIPRVWRKFVAIDFGSSLDHATCIQFWALSPEYKWYCYREMYMTGRTVSDYAPQLRRYIQEDEITSSVICDWAAEERAQLSRHGIKSTPAIKQRIAGQRLCHDLISHDKIFFFSNRLVEEDLDLKLHKMPTSTTDEFGLYTWANKDKEDMIHKYDHGMDTMRYMMSTFYKKRLHRKISRPIAVQI